MSVGVDRARATASRFPAIALMLGNVVIALSILGPAGMLSQLADGLSVDIRAAGLLVTFGAAVLCFGSPLMTWAASGFERRRLLAATLALVGAGHIATALATGYTSVLVLRIAILVIGAIFTPMAASTIALVVSDKDRAGAISFVFLGWALAIAAGLPVVTVVAVHFGWRAVYAALGVAAFAAAGLVQIALPARLKGATLSAASWGVIMRDRHVLWLLMITVLWTCGQFVLFPFLGPLIARLAGGGAGIVALCFTIMGIMGFVGNVLATRAVTSMGAHRMSVVFSASMFFGTLVWAVGAGAFVAMIAGVAFWGFGFAALNSMQQARLVAVAPALSGATVALNTSANYVGQGIGSALGGEMLVRDLLVSMGFVAAAFMLAALVAVMMSGRDVSAAPESG